jgi:hypothetical protein
MTVEQEQYIMSGEPVTHITETHRRNMMKRFIGIQAAESEDGMAAQPNPQYKKGEEI